MVIDIFQVFTRALREFEPIAREVDEAVDTFEEYVAVCEGQGHPLSYG